VSTHSNLGPSKAKQWTECTASVQFIEENEHRLPRDRGSVYADEGTTAHRWCELVLKGEVALGDVPAALRPHVGRYVETCRALMPDGGFHVLGIEREVSLFYKPTDIGTVDFIVATAEVIHIRDYKHGEGVLVHSDWNKQLAIYAWSAILPLVETGVFDWADDTKVTIQAVQPRHHEWVDAPWETSLGELRRFCEEEIAPKAKAILEGGATEFAPGEETCRWCRAKAICPARAAALSVIPCDVFEDLTVPLPAATALDEGQLLALFRNTKVITAFLGDVGKHLTAMALSGSPLEGTKLVTGRQTNRAWADEGVAAAALGNAGVDPWVRTVLSPAAAEKKLKEQGAKLDLAPFTTRSQGQPVLALASDKRPALDAATVEFSNLDDTEDS